MGVEGAPAGVPSPSGGPVIAIAFEEQIVDYLCGDPPQATELDARKFAAGDQVLDVLARATEGGCDFGWRIGDTLDIGICGRDHETSMDLWSTGPSRYVSTGTLQAMHPALT
jgi:hypothetical protein